MTNIKYLDKKIKQEVESLFKKEQFYKEILLKLLNKWNIINPLIEDYFLDYDCVVFNISDKYSISYEIKIDFDLDSVVVIQKKKNFYKTYKIFNGELEIYSKGYLKNNQKLERIYRDDKIFEYSFENKNLNSKIYIDLVPDYQLDEVLFIKTLLENKDQIKDITSLYTKIKDILKIEKICIINNNQGYQEKIVIVSDNLFEYKRLILKEDGIEYLNYQDGKILSYSGRKRKF